MSTLHVPSSIKTKKALREALVGGKRIFLTDPSMFNPQSRYVYEIKDGESVIVTNHPRRSWFATITKRDGKLEVK